MPHWLRHDVYNYGLNMQIITPASEAAKWEQMTSGNSYF